MCRAAPNLRPSSFQVPNLYDTTALPLGQTEKSTDAPTVSVDNTQRFRSLHRGNHARQPVLWFDTSDKHHTTYDESTAKKVVRATRWLRNDNSLPGQQGRSSRGCLSYLHDTQSCASYRPRTATVSPPKAQNRDCACSGRGLLGPSYFVKAIQLKHKITILFLQCFYAVVCYTSTFDE